AAESDVVLAFERSGPALKLAVGLRLEVGIEGASSDALEGERRFNFSARRLPGAERAARPFPDVPHQLLDAVDAGPIGQGLHPDRGVVATPPDVGPPPVHRFAPGKTPLHRFGPFGKYGPRAGLYPLRIGRQAFPRPAGERARLVPRHADDRIIVGAARE